jgi:hypothetical protein
MKNGLTNLLFFLIVSGTAFGQTNKKSVGDSIQGNWEGNKQTISAKVVQLKAGAGNPVDGGTPAEWAVVFSSPRMKPLKIGCCDAILVNEGDLYSDGKEELSIYQAPLNGCAHRFTTLKYRANKWDTIIPPILIPSGCDGIDLNELQKRVVKEGNTVYVYEEDVNDEKLRLIKRKVTLKP